MLSPPTEPESLIQTIINFLSSSFFPWKVHVPTDKKPAGKREDLSLREKEKQIKKDLADGLNTIGGKMTVCQLYAKKNSQRKNVKRNTEKGRQYLDVYKRQPITQR